MIRSARRRRLPALLAITALGAGAFALGSAPAQATADFTITRIQGPTRHDTAAQLALGSFPAGSATALIVRDDTFPDALAGNYTAGLLNAPILLSGRDSVPNVTLTTLDTLNATSVTLLGGPDALSNNVRNQLVGIGLTVNRIEGADRFATAAAIATGPGAGAVGLNENDEKTAVLSSGLNFPDALASGPIVFSQHFPQLLTGAGALPSTTKAALTTLGIDHVIITGGPVAVPAAVDAELSGMGIGVERIAGDTRFTTAIQLAVKAGTAFGFQDEHVNLATAANFPDALAGGPHGGKELAATILVPPTATSGDDFDDVCAALDAIDATLATAHAFGGPVAIAEAVLTAIDACGTPDGPAAGTGQVVTVNNGTDQYQFVQASNNAVISVTHDAQDTFRVDGAAVNQAVFEGAITPGDQITFTDDATATDADVHDLTNVTLTSGMVGNVNIAANTFDIINPVTGDDVGGWTWNDASDTFGGTLQAFENSISEGDTINVTVANGDPTAFALTNAAVSGAVTAVSADAVDADIEIGVFGDEAENAQNVSFKAAAAAGAGEDYIVDGNAAATYEQFRTALSVGDTLSVTRTDVGGVAVETFTLTNVAPAPITGQVTSFINTAELPDPGDGDRFAVVPAAGGYREVDYSATPTFRVDNVIVDEAGFEAALTPGDTVTFQPGSSTPNVPETLSLTNAALSGQWGGIDVPSNIYAVRAADKVTVLAIVDYTAPGVPALVNQYFINGVQRTEAQWEALASDVLFDAADLDDTVSIDEAGGFRNHRLTTTDTLTP